MLTGRRGKRWVDEPDPDAEQDEPGEERAEPEVEVMPCMSTNATAHTASPPPISARIGARVDIFPEIGATTNASSEIGRKRIPVSSGE